MLAVAATETISLLSTPLHSPVAGRPKTYVLEPLADIVRQFRAVLDKLVETGLIDIPSHALSPMIHLRVPAARAREMPRDTQEMQLQRVVDDCLANDVLVARAAHVWSQEMAAIQGLEIVRPSIRICLSAGLARKDADRAANVIRNAVRKVFGKP